MMPWHIDAAAREHGAGYIQGDRFKVYAVRRPAQHRQQQSSGGEVARHLIEPLGAVAPAEANVARCSTMQ
jgi:hypothetical protein